MNLKKLTTSDDVVQITLKPITSKTEEVVVVVEFRDKLNISVSKGEFTPSLRLMIDGKVEEHPYDRTRMFSVQNELESALRLLKIAMEGEEGREEFGD